MPQEARGLALLLSEFLLASCLFLGLANLLLFPLALNPLDSLAPNILQEGVDVVDVTDLGTDLGKVLLEFRYTWVGFVQKRLDSITLCLLQLVAKEPQAQHFLANKVLLPDLGDSLLPVRIQCEVLLCHGLITQPKDRATM